MTGLYIHIPYCKTRCNYCDFYTKGGNDIVPDDYLNALKRELIKHQNITFDTIYFGGGTPSLLSCTQVVDILNAIKKAPSAEITLEANPESLTFEKLDAYFNAGVNRLSIGVQTIYDNSLTNLGRSHNSEMVQNALDMAKLAGFTNISADLILATDNYTLKEMTDTIDFFDKNNVTHISAYLLKIEPGTPFYNNTPKNLPSEDDTINFYLSACDYLNKKGYTQYEISNFAKDNKQSKHNNIYWQLENYIGIGPSAHSCYNGKRFYYENSLSSFIDGNAPIFDGDVTVDDYIMLSLRLKTGLNLDVLKDKWGVTITSGMINKLHTYKTNGYLFFENNIISLTPKGFLVENMIASDVMANYI